MSVPPQTQPPRAKRPPLPVLFALALMAPSLIGLAYDATRALLDADLVDAAGSIVALVLWGVLLSRLWAGGRIAYVLAVVLTALRVIVGLVHVATLDTWDDALFVGQGVLGVAVLLLLLAAPSSRSFFARRRA